MFLLFYRMGNSLMGGIIAGIVYTCKYRVPINMCGKFVAT